MKPQPCSAPADFMQLSEDHGPVPFWWWVGEPLERGRMEWQLDRLREQGVRMAIVSYSHRADGSTDMGSPAVFSAEWWDLFRWALEACERRGMRLGFQDYMLLNPVIQEIGRDHADMEGAGGLRECSVVVKGSGSARLEVEGGGDVLLARAFPFANGQADAEASIDVTAFVRGTVLEWSAPVGGEWLVSVVWVRPNPFDPLHPESGARVIERYYAMFEREVGRHLGKTFPISFQDELDFGARMPLWSPRLPDAFRALKGYALGPWLHALWHDLGPRTPKLRVDFSDVVVRILEEAYFKPVFEWHERRGLLFGNDNQGRGGIEDGRRSYGDAFRTMRWFSAPGTDDPNLAHARAFKGLKVNSSIAHLYGRPRVWNEAFHSSGWGTAPSSVVAALNADFVLGATVVNLHGLYYSTFGGWWEWAPPDFHFRQPYWEHVGRLSDYITRVCSTLCRGAHVCDVAILYPITALEGGLNPRVRAGASSDITAYEVGSADTARFDAAEAAAFAIGRVLLRAGIDFDFIDFESLDRAESAEGKLSIAGESYSVIVLPEMSTIRFSNLVSLERFKRAGGAAIAYGVLPMASDREGAQDPEVDRLVAELFSGDGRFRQLAGDCRAVLDEVERLVPRDFSPGSTGFQVVHRREGELDFYFVVNPGTSEAGGRIGFRACGPCARLDPWTGNSTSVLTEDRGGVSFLDLRLGPGDAALFRFGGKLDVSAREPVAPKTKPAVSIDLPEEWDVELIPTLDNCHGDFRWPPSDACIGAEARQFRHAMQKADAFDCALPGYDDSGWETMTYSHGPRFLRIGPLPPGLDTRSLEAQLAASPFVDPSLPIEWGGRQWQWEPVSFSTRWGIERDPYLTDRLSGPHGLKGEVPDEFLDFDCDEPGSSWLVWTCVVCERAQTRHLIAGSRARMRVWLNGELGVEQTQELPPGRQTIWNLPHYKCDPITRRVDLRAGGNALVVRLVQPRGQRTRAFAAFPAGELREALKHGTLGMRWFLDPTHPIFDPYPASTGTAAWFRFRVPTGARSFCVTSRGACRLWHQGRELVASSVRAGEQDARVTQFESERPETDSSQIAIRVETPRGSHGADALPEPVRIACSGGRLRLGDWCNHHLDTYSGIIAYKTRVRVDTDDLGSATTLDLGDVAATAEVRVNGTSAGYRLCAPWRFEIGSQLRAGENVIEVRVANTLSNHYSIGIPTPFARKEQQRSGLMGPVKIERIR